MRKRFDPAWPARRRNPRRRGGVRQIEPKNRAAELLRWQMLGSFVKLIGWPIGFVVLASGRSGLFVFTQFVWNAVFVLCLYLLLEQFGLLAIGIAFCFAYAFGVLNVWFVSDRLIGMTPTRFNVMLVTFLIVLGSVIIYLAESSPGQSIVVGVIITAVVAIYSFRNGRCMA